MSPTQDSASDPVLTSINSAFVTKGKEVGMTFLVGGSWISGTVVSPRSWFEQLAVFVDNVAPDNKYNKPDNKWGLAVRALGEAAYPSESEIDAGNSAGGLDPSNSYFIHLRDAQLVYGTPSSSIPYNGGLLRLRANSVDGWIFGRFWNSGSTGNMYRPPTYAT